MKPVIGLEVHVELKTKSKMFCGCKAEYFGEKPNTNTCPVCLGLPGALPVPNKKAIEYCVMLGLALSCEIPLFSKFDRKNYFYPDLPKGYQISQYDQPFCVNGSVVLSNGKKIRIRRVHMEEDTGKLVHEAGSTLIDFNRSGVPLVEIVTEPDFENATDVKEYLKKLQQIVRDLGVSDADMEKGQMRLEPNISLSGPKKTYKVEVKNINSFSFVEKAINYELKRQEEIIKANETPVQETRGWNEKKQITETQRIKEEASDYRYFPEPDIPPIRWKTEDIERIRGSMSKLAEEKQKELVLTYHITPASGATISRIPDLYKSFEPIAQIGQENYGTASEVTANMLINKRIPYLDLSHEEAAKRIAELNKVETINDKELSKIIDEVLKTNEKAVEDYKKGKEQAIMFLVGQVMRKLPQKTDASQIKASLLAKLKNARRSKI